MFCLLRVGAVPDHHPLKILALVVGVVITLVVVVTVHEAGHVVAAWLCGGTLLSVRVGPFVVRRHPCGLRVALSVWRGPHAGAALCVRLGRAWSRRAFALVLLGGPAANLVFGLVMVGVATQMVRGSTPGFVAGTLAMASLLIGVLNVVPWSSIPIADGQRLLELARSTPTADQTLALYELTGIAAAGVRPSRWPAEAVARASQLGVTSPAGPAGHLLRAYHREDLGDLVGAAEDLLMVIAVGPSPELRFTACCLAAHMLARDPARAAEARAWFEAAGPGGSDPASHDLTRAVVLAAEGESAAAAEIAFRLARDLDRVWLSPVVSEDTHELLQRLASLRS
ncbi:MAG: M50 family metallopeptidase [Alphaproteobacteria bacterium]|nr:M50 family metallopeptidase [Alphaproteobacteria bacterium]